MFTGIVECIGKVISFRIEEKILLWDGTYSKGAVLIINIKNKKNIENIDNKNNTEIKNGIENEKNILDINDIHDDKYSLENIDKIKQGDSLCINGVCLTVINIKIKDQNYFIFTFNIAPETLDRTNLGDLKTGSEVNVERGILLKGECERNSGHKVEGHVDCRGLIIKKYKQNDSVCMFIKVADKFIQYIVSKGFMSIDGVSLSICEVNYEENFFSVMLIPYTQNHTINASKNINDTVNIEIDVMAKYVFNMQKNLYEERIQKIEHDLAILKEKCNAV